MRKYIFTFILVVLMVGLAIDYYMVPTLADSASCESGGCKCSCSGISCQCTAEKSKCTCSCLIGGGSDCGMDKDGAGDEQKINRPG